MSAGSVCLLLELIAESVCLLELVVLSMDTLVRVMGLPVLAVVTMALDTLVMVVDLTVVTGGTLVKATGLLALAMGTTLLPVDTQVLFGVWLQGCAYSMCILISSKATHSGTFSVLYRAPSQLFPMLHVSARHSSSTPAWMRDELWVSLREVGWYSD